MDRPDLFWQQRPLLTDDASFVPSLTLWGDRGKLDSWHDMPSDPPSTPNHQHRADETTLQSEEMAGVKDARRWSLLRKLWAALSPI